MKKAVSFILCIALVFTLAGANVNAANLSYDADAALSYAANHWNDGVGKCATFVSNCIKAGGCTVGSSTVTSLNSLLINSGYCNRYELTKTSTYYVYESKNSGKISAGDPILFYCKTCGGWQHAAICAGFDSNGRALLYGHNPAWQANKATSIGGYIDAAGHTGSPIVVYSYRMIGKSHTHNYERGYESAHPHKVYMKCSCGDWYYTGETRESDNCNTCYNSSHPKVHISLDANGGMLGTKEFYYRVKENKYYSDSELNNEITSIDIPTRNGYTLVFFGDGNNPYIYGAFWFESMPEGYGCGDIAPNLSTDITSDTTLYALWAVNEYYLTYDLDGGTVPGTNPDAFTIESDDIVLCNPVKEGYDFVGWQVDGLAETMKNVTIPKGSVRNHSFKAVYKKIEVPPAENTDFKVIIESKRATVGSTFTVDVFVEDNKGFTYLELTPVIPDQMRLVSVKNGKLMGMAQGKQYVWAADGDVTANGLLMTFTFTTTDGIEPGDYEIGFIVNGCVNYDEQNVAVTVVNGKISAVNFIYGDVDGDGKVTVSDVVWLRQQIVSGAYSNREFAAGNLDDSDNLLTVSDVVELRKRIVQGG